ncbi:MAG: carbamoyl-phosphate synthase domain-containing protein, partial [Thermoleophilia bacterium]
MPSPALLVLEDGAAYRGEAVAGAGTVGGEIVFNTAMAGYQEIATDPSYCGQIITYTFPLNGNYGADPSRDESGQAHARAIIARELVNYAFNRASTSSWLDWLNAHGVLAVGGVDTRALTRHIRSQGALRAVVSTDDPDVSSLRRRAQRLPRMTGLDLASVVSCGEPSETAAGAPSPDGADPLHVVAFDFGIKRSIVGYLAAAGCRVTVVPAATPAREVLKLRPDGIFLSNG